MNAPADLLKDLTERIGVTFVYAGFDVAAASLFGGVRGAGWPDGASLIDYERSPPGSGNANSATS
ncbi:hypothetical protein [Embleya sp. NPDC005575]|uniref:hypothetical protein n=1 Tax=Embleya sp. NPDC005575 TaxID=3156892 RepID=UPI0033AA2808